MEEDEEIWKDVVGWEGLYQVSNLGRVRSLLYNKVEIRKQPLNNRGYYFVWIYRKGKATYSLVHRLVAMAFIPNPENKRTVNHKDGDKTNNHVLNLEWNTDGENQLHAYRTGLRRSCMSGQDDYIHSCSKEIHQYSLTGEYIQSFVSSSHAARCVGGSDGNISTYATSPEKHAHSYGYKWSREKRDIF